MNFVLEQGLIKIDLIKMDDEKIKELMAMEDFIGPGGCGSLRECDEYCKVSEHVKECISFMNEYGLIPFAGPPSEEAATGSIIFVEEVSSLIGNPFSSYFNISVLTEFMSIMALTFTEALPGPKGASSISKTFFSRLRSTLSR